MANSDSAPIVRHDLLGRITEIENVFIPMSDGCRIAARIWLPDDAETRPVPAILEYIPYRKRDFMRARDEPIHRYFAAHGYVAVRVDVRGSGDSECVLHDEYTLQEHRDALEIIDWLAEQPWCNGTVGMMGISWGGFNALQVAALNPPALKAIITLCSTDDRYADDAHYMGGCLLNENLQWGSILMAYSALPPDPLIVGERWREMWLERLGHAVAFPELWMSHPWRDAYWRHGSICEDYAAIKCAVYAVGGWADGYSNAVPRLVAGLRCPRKGLIGPWAHTFPHSGIPGPSIGFLQEAVLWWDHWLGGRDNGIMDEPMLRVWMQDSVSPQPQYEQRPGRWVAEAAWPSPRIGSRQLYLQPGLLQDAMGDDLPISIASPQTTGAGAGEWCGFGADGEMPLDQRLDDGRSLVFDGNVLSEPLAILGAPRVALQLEVDVPVALIAVRLNDVAPDGAATQVTYGLLNLCHRDGHAAPEPLEPGRRYRVEVVLNDVAQVFPPGHRIRLAISTSYWPIAWPAPEVATLTVHTGSSRLILPVRDPDPGDDDLRTFEPPEVAPGPRHRPLRPLPLRRTVELDLTSNEWVYTLTSDGGEFGGHDLAHIEDIGMDLGYRFEKRHRIAEGDPLSAKTEIAQRVSLRRADWSVRVEVRTRLRATAESLHFGADMDAYQGDELVVSRRWDSDIPRRLY